MLITHGWPTFAQCEIWLSAVSHCSIYSIEYTRVYKTPDLVLSVTPMCNLGGRSSQCHDTCRWSHAVESKRNTESQLALHQRHYCAVVEWIDRVLFSRACQTEQRLVHDCSLSGRQQLHCARSGQAVVLQRKRSGVLNASRWHAGVEPGNISISHNQPESFTFPHSVRKWHFWELPVALSSR